MAQEKTKATNNNTIAVAVVTGLVTLVLGYILGATIGFSFGGNSGNSKWAGVYTSETWNGNQRVSLTLNEDGTCSLPSQYNNPCTYEVKGNKVYFNGENTSYATVGETGIVYHDNHFTKLK